MSALYSTTAKMRKYNLLPLFDDLNINFGDAESFFVTIMKFFGGSFQSIRAVDAKSQIYHFHFHGLILFIVINNFREFDLKSPHPQNFFKKTK